MSSQSNKGENMLWSENLPDDSSVGEPWRCQEHFIHTLYAVDIMSALLLLWKISATVWNKIISGLNCIVFEIGSDQDRYYSVLFTTEAEV